MNAQGFTLLETMIGASVAMIVSLGIGAYLHIAKKSQGDLRAMQDFNDLVQQVSVAMDDTKICTENFSPYTITPNANPQRAPTTSINVDFLKVFNVDTGGQVASIAERGQASGQTLTIRPLNLTIKQPLGNNRYLANLAITAVKFKDPTKDKMAADPNDVLLTQNLSIFLATDKNTNRIQYCYAANGPPPELMSDICKVSSDGLLYYNVKNKECEYRYKKEMYSGTRSRASCPPDTDGIWTGKGFCRSDASEYAPMPITRKYENALELPALPPKVFICEIATPSTTAVSCIYASDYTKPATCQVACKIDLMPELIADGDAPSQ